MTVVELESESAPDAAVERFAARLVQPPYLVVQGSFAVADTPAGATTLVVEDGSDFDDSGEGGWVRLRFSADADVPDVYVEYADWDGDETDVEFLTLRSPLPVAVPEGTPVDLWDPVDLRPDASYEAVVTFDDADANAFKVDVKADAVDAFPTDADLTRGLAVTLERVVGEDDIYLVRPDGDLVRDGNKTPMTLDAFMRTTGQKDAETVTNVEGARVHSDHDSLGRGRLRWFADDGTTVIGQIRGIVDEATQRFIFGIAGGDQSNPSRIRAWTYAVGNSIRRRIDLIADEVQINGLIQATNGLTLQLSPTIAKGFDGNSNVTRVLSNTGTTTVPHLVAGGGTVQVGLRGSNSKLFDIDVGQVTGSEITFAVTWRRAGDGHAGGDPAVNETVSFDWSIWAYDRPSPVV